MSHDEQNSKKATKKQPALETLEIGNAVYTTRLTSKFRNRINWERPDERIVKAIIPGTIQRIMVKEGDQVKTGQALLILEAMKMRNEVLAPLDGVVRAIHVAEGEQVPKSHVLVELD